MNSDESARLNKKQRQASILQQLKVKPLVLISDLAQEFHVSIETVRRDLDMLAEASLLQRAHGGATSLSTAIEGTLNVRKQLFPKQRTAIAKTAEQLVENGQVIMFDSSATCVYLASRLAISRNYLTIITNSHAIAMAASGNPTHKVIMLPGLYRATEGSCYGSASIQAIRQYNADHCFSSGGSITVEGVTEYDQDVAALKREMIQRARQTTILADHAKFGLGKLEIVCRLEELDYLITDQQPLSAIANKLALKQVKLIIAEA
ncbi:MULTISPECIES: DeoR/GlpR family DNA-binding transcription regulator [Thiomicrorhabdus]|uniref:DeoR/GlpR transcriptional regulator n=1 Tax=Thiomicrorhabdus heinhorstiae TaxID=2748010 RepID=A0ABS0BVI0_9GAMM|nr:MULTISPECIES: DeoR/GlpR family DNA-binding transcription regulator [Thiomicrorhabdus]MBF6057837.1 DeoR/GlpR transcriptional regulator [Thiomicrorhabdus heinhorstiae]